MDCNIRVTASEWSKLKEERLRLSRELDDARRNLERLQREMSSVMAEMSSAVGTESRIRSLLVDLERREDSAVATEDAALRVLESAERSEVTSVLDLGSNSPGLALQPLTWTSWDGLPDSFWDTSLSSVGQ